MPGKKEKQLEVIAWQASQHFDKKQQLKKQQS